MPSRTRWFGLLFISIAVSLIIVDSTIVNVAIPSIVDDLKIDSTQVQWVQESYTLVFAALLILFGTLADRIGRRRLLVIGVAVFTAASILAGLSTSGELLIAARVMQGVGGAMVLPTTLWLINATFRGRERAIAFAIWGSTIGGMAAIGPLLGGWLTTDFSWRLAFGVNVPFGIAVIIGVYFTVTESASSERTRFDLVGAVFSIVATGSLVYGLIQGRELGWWTTNGTIAVGSWTWPLAIAPTPFFFLLSALARVSIIEWERGRTKRGKATMLPLGLFSIASFRNGNIVAMIISLGELGLLFILPLWLQNVLRERRAADGAHPAGAGHRLLPRQRDGERAVAPALAGRHPAAGRRTRAGRVAAAGLPAAQRPGLARHRRHPLRLRSGSRARERPDHERGAGRRPRRKSGRASGTQSTSRQVGSALGVAVLGTLLFSSLSAHLSDGLSALDSGERARIVSAVTDSAAQPSRDSSTTRPPPSSAASRQTPSPEPRRRLRSPPRSSWPAHSSPPSFWEDAFAAIRVQCPRCGRRVGGRRRRRGPAGRAEDPASPPDGGDHHVRGSERPDRHEHPARNRVALAVDERDHDDRHQQRALLRGEQRHGVDKIRQAPFNDGWWHLDSDSPSIVVKKLLMAGLVAGEHRSATIAKAEGWHGRGIC